MWTSDRNEDFFELMDQYNSGIEPLENWDTDDLISLQMVISEELAERDRVAQNEYFEKQMIEDEESYGGTDSE